MRIAIAVCVAGLIGCGPPVLQNAPRPNPAIVAGAAAAIAGVATLADPAAAARAVEANKPAPELRPTTVNRTVPSDVFDRLDKQHAPEPEPEETIDARD
ncbi:MAG: hypothetical protein H0T79_23255 [Deltaproteobacteria bacterium]|nr:hypothetical protein [Deltaproteobacteria bacterium]